MGSIVEGGEPGPARDSALGSATAEVCAADPGPDPLRLLVIVLNFRTPAMTLDCLRSLEREVTTLGDARVLVVENGSGDDSSRVLGNAIAANGWGGWAGLVVSDVNLGFAGGVCLAHERGPRARHVLLLNSDTAVPAGTLEYCLRRLEDEPGIGALGIRQVLGDGSTENCVRRFPTPGRMLASSLGLPWRFPRLFGWADTEDAGWDRRNLGRDVDWIGGAFLLVSSQAVAAAGGLLDRGFFFTGEDVEFCHRLQRAGYRRVYDPTVWVRHLHGGSSDPSRVTPRDLMRHTLAARYRVQRKCYGFPAEILLRVTDLLVQGARTAWLALMGPRAARRYQTERRRLSALLDILGRQR